MAFISKEDLYLSILEDELNEITRGNDAIITAAISAAEADLRVYLFDSYDVDTIFSSVGTARHQMLVQLCADVTIWFLVARLQAGQDTDARKSRYDRAIAWLKMVKRSGTYADLPRRESTVQTHISHGSNLKRNNYF